MKMSNVGGYFGKVHSKPTGCFREVQVGTNKIGDALNAIRDESGEVRMKMSTGVGLFGEWSSSFGEAPSKPTVCFGEIKVGTNNCRDTLNASEYKQ